MRVLLVEDDSLLGDGVQSGLRQHGFQVDWVRDGIAAEYELRGDTSESYSVVILDLGLPRQDGLEVLRNIRANNVKTPVLILTAREAIPDRIRGLDLGADDYVIKPVDLDELVARLRALVRRSHGQIHDSLQIHDLELDQKSRTVKRANQPIVLSSREYDLLLTFALNADRVLSRDQLEKNLYSWGHEVESNTVEVFVHNLRKKLGSDLIQTVRGVGYVLQKQRK